MRRIILTGFGLLSLVSPLWAETACVEENGRVQAAVQTAQNLMLQNIVLQGQLSALRDQLKTAQDEKSKATNPKAESSSTPTPQEPPTP